MKNEGDVKKRVKDVLKATPNCWWFMPPANGFGRSGIPDIICCVNGRFFAIECKAGKGMTTALQNRELQHIEDAGGMSLIAREDSLQDIRDIIQQLRELP